MTVPKGLTAVANGRLAETRDNADGTRTFHWIQKGPIPNYLVTVDVAELAKVPLRDAKVWRGTRSQDGAARRLDAARDGRGGAVRLREHARHGRVLLDEDGLPLSLGQVRPGGAPRVLRRDGDDDGHGILGVGAAPRRRSSRSRSGLRGRLADLHVRGRRGPRARAPLVRRPRDLPFARLDLAERVVRDLLALDVEWEGSRRRRSDVSALGVSRQVRRLRARDRQRPADGVPPLQGPGRDVPGGDDVRKGRAGPPHDPSFPGRGRLRSDDRGVSPRARVLERRLGGLEGGHRARRRPEPDRVFRRLDRRRRRAPAVRGVLPVGRRSGSRST